MNTQQTKKTPREVVIKLFDDIAAKEPYEVIYKLLDDNVLIHSMVGNYVGAERIDKVLSQWLEGFPDIEFNVLRSIAEGENVVIYFEVNGTHNGIFKNIPPSGRKIHIRGALYFRIINEKITEYSSFLDMRNLMQQIL